MHRETSIGWLKSTSPITTVHYIARSKVETVLLEVTLTPTEVSQFTPTPSANTNDDEITKHDKNNIKQRNYLGNANSLKENEVDDYYLLELPNMISSVSQSVIATDNLE